MNDLTLTCPTHDISQYAHSLPLPPMLDKSTILLKLTSFVFVFFSLSLHCQIKALSLTFIHTNISSSSSSSPPIMSSQTLKRVLHSLSCGKYKVIKRVAAGSEGAAVGEKDKSTGGLIKTTDSFVFNAAFRFVIYLSA